MSITSDTPPAPMMEADAIAFAKARVGAAVGADVLVELEDRQQLYSEMRKLLKLFLRTYQSFTTVTLAVDPDGSLSGWLVESRKRRSTVSALSDAEVEERALSVLDAPGRFRLQWVKRVEVDAGCSFAVATLQRDDGTLHDVTVNHETGEIIGYLPHHSESARSFTASDAELESLRALAFAQIKRDLLARVGSETAARTGSILRLTPLGATRDARGCRQQDFHVWRFYSTCDVTMDETNGELVGWFIDALQEPVSKEIIGKAAARKAARPELIATWGVMGPRLSLEKSGPDKHIVVHWWHVEDGFNIEGDHTTVLLNATTGAVFSVWRKWRAVPEQLLGPAVISESQAMLAADQATASQRGGAQGQVLGRSIIQVADSTDEDSPVHDVNVWRIGYRLNGGINFLEVAIDSRTGHPVRMTGW